MCEWKNSPNWFKELVGLLFSGILLFLLLSVVLCHLKKSENNISESVTLSVPSNISVAPINKQDIKNTHELSNTTAYFNPADATAILGPYLNKLGWVDVLILVFIWPIGMLFVRFSKSFSKRVYKKIIL